MERYRVQVRAETPERRQAAFEAIEAAGLPCLTLTMDTPESPTPPMRGQSFAGVEAENSAAAEAKVREIVGDDCNVGPAVPVDKAETWPPAG